MKNAIALSLHRAFQRVVAEMEGCRQSGEHKILDLLKQSVRQDNVPALQLLLNELLIDELLHRDNNLHLNALLREAMLAERDAMVVRLIKEGARPSGVFKRIRGESGEEIEFCVCDELGEKKPSQAMIARASFHAGTVGRTARALGLSRFVRNGGTGQPAHPFSSSHPH